ncbi:MAG: ATP-binding protein, partial [Myxococcales bacterium]|nr:ATP-binding protein [Myxococcales bacterium]
MGPFLNRVRELARLRKAFDAGAPLVTVYGRRRLGKSRLLREALGGRQGVYFAGDAREAHVQRAALAAEAGRVLPGFGDVTYPDWTSLLSRLYRDGPKGLVVVLDEFTDLVDASPELPSVLRNHIDTSSGNVT